jgi:hypothetical protein
MLDFFVSYTATDEAWAEWLAWALEEAGFSTVLQKWDFAAGSNFVLEMQKAAAQARRTIAVLSPDYLTKSRFGAAEWAAAFAADPDGQRRGLVPARVKECVVDGLLKPIVYIDLVGLGEAEAKQRLLDNLTGTRRKPVQRPSFPGAAAPARRFPGGAQARQPSKTGARYMPRIRGAITDVDRRRFSKAAFGSIQRRFEESLAELARQNQGVEFDLTPVDATKFTAEIFVGGKSRARCKIWIGGMMGGDDIAYAEGQAMLGSNSLNEDLSLKEVDGELVLSSLMGAAFSRPGDGLESDSEFAAQVSPWRAVVRAA